MGSVSSVPSLRQPTLRCAGASLPPGDAPAPTEAERHVSRHDCGSVLIVEDDIKFARLVERAFARVGLCSVHTETGDAALHAIRSQPGLCAVVLDVMIPHPDGIEVCHHLRRTEPQLPVVMMSARSGGEQRDRARAAGAGAFVSKPFPLHRLVRLTCELIDAEPAEPVENP
ncbi:MAG: response regulator transcription factor [Acidimicrobiales bacterium]